MTSAAIMTDDRESPASNLLPAAPARQHAHSPSDMLPPGCDPIFSTVYSLAQKSGGPSLSGDLVAHRLHAALQIRGDRPQVLIGHVTPRRATASAARGSAGSPGSFPVPGVVDVISTSGVSSGRRP